MLLGDFETAFLSGFKAPSQRSSPSFFRRLRSIGTATNHIFDHNKKTPARFNPAGAINQSRLTQPIKLNY